MTTVEKKAVHLVADAGGFIRHARLDNLADNVYTLQEVVGEIRDPTTKQRLSVLPYELQMRRPSPHALAFVTEFARKTGDSASLSKTDLAVAALTYQLAKEKDPELPVRTEPLKGQQSVVSGRGGLVAAADTHLVGFVRPKLKPKTPINEVESSSTETGVEEEEAAGTPSDEMGKLSLESQEAKSDSEDEEEEEEERNERDSESEEESEEEEEGDGGWITKDNISAAVKGMNSGAEAVEGRLSVACISTDFALQNLLLQIGLPVLSIDGLRLRRLQTWILRCYACFKTTSVMNKKFCPACGNATLKRVAVSVDPDSGQTSIFISKKKKLTGKGLRYSLPRPQGHIPLFS